MRNPTLVERETTHGSFRESSQVYCDLAEILSDGSRVDSWSAPMRTAATMILIKLARAACGEPYHVDTWRDIAGYAALVVEALEPPIEDELDPFEEEHRRMVLDTFEGAKHELCIQKYGQHGMDQAREDVLVEMLSLLSAMSTEEIITLMHEVPFPKSTEEVFAMAPEPAAGYPDIPVTGEEDEAWNSPWGAWHVVHVEEEEV